MDTVRVGGVAVGKLDRPGQCAGAAIATSIHQAPDAAEGVSESDAGREDVGGFPERQFFPADVKDAGERRANESAVKDEPASADVENLPERPAREILAPIGKDIETARADECAENQ